MKLKKIDETGKPYRIYAEVLESEAIDQFIGAMQQDSIVKGALMPDAHAGYTLPIGAVVAVDGMVYPSFVGFDIGCGMCAVRTTFDVDAIKASADLIFKSIYELLPVGFAHGSKAVDWHRDAQPDHTKAAKEILAGGGLKQLGTLGGGNHFVEIGEDENKNAWIVIHSGSRNVGHRLATHYMKLASPDNKAREGFFGLRVDEQKGQDYIADLNFALAFALENRIQILNRVTSAIQRHVSGGMSMESLINRNHNHAELKDGLWIHRKGATHAEDGMMGVIPGNMRDGSFIVRGMGNPESLYSSSHGAGRVLGRKQAKATLNLSEFAETMKGVTARVDSSTLDESPDAYKNIFDVMAMQSDLVAVTDWIKPIINIKG